MGIGDNVQKRQAGVASKVIWGSWSKLFNRGAVYGLDQISDMGATRMHARSSAGYLVGAGVGQGP